MKKAVRRLGLYTLTTESADTLDDLMALAPDGVLKDDPLARVRSWAKAIAARAETISRRRNLPTSTRDLAARCARPANVLRIFLDKASTTRRLDAHEVGIVAEAAAELADDWHSVAANATFEAPVAKQQRSADTGRRNRQKENERRQDTADAAAISDFSNWQRKAVGALWRGGSLLPLNTRTALYRRARRLKPTSKQARRLTRLASVGRLPDPPVP